MGHHQILEVFVLGKVWENLKMQNRTLSIVANLFLVVFSIFFTLVLLEIGLRLFYTPTEPLNLEEITPWDAIDMD
jgi:hypothetical protein